LYMDDYRVDGTFVCESVRLRRPLVATRPSAEPTPRPATQNHYNPSISRPHSLSTCRPLEPAVAEGLSARRCRRRRPRRRSDSSESPPRTRPRPRPRPPPDAAARTPASAAPAPAPAAACPCLCLAWAPGAAAPAPSAPGRLRLRLLRRRSYRGLTCHLAGLGGRGLCGGLQHAVHAAPGPRERRLHVVVHVNTTLTPPCIILFCMENH
jgi:hypothetical protein